MALIEMNSLGINVDWGGTMEQEFLGNFKLRNIHYKTVNT